MYFDFGTENPIRVLFRDSEVELQSDSNLNPLLPLSEVCSEFGCAMAAWLQASKDLDSVFDLYFGVQYLPQFNREAKLRNYAQAVESFHERHIIGGSKSVPFRERIIEYLDWLGSLMTPLMNDRAAFAEKVMQTRHYLTHYNLKRKTASANGYDIEHLNRLLEVMLEAGLIRVLGVPETRCVELFKRNPRYCMLAQHPWPL